MQTFALQVVAFLTVLALLLSQNDGEVAEVDDAIYAATLIERHYIYGPNISTLLVKGMEGARALAVHHGVEVSEEVPFLASPNIRANSATFREEMDKLILSSRGVVSEEEFVWAAIEAMAAEMLDLHSSYVTPREVLERERFASLMQGVSRVITADGDTLVWDVRPDTPAADAGMRPGDVLLDFEAELESLADFGPDIKVSRGDEVLTMRLKPRRPDDRFYETRMVEDVAYLQLYSLRLYGDVTVDEFNSLEEDARDLQQQQPVGWILDLRNNPGGGAMFQTVGGLLGYQGFLMESRRLRDPGYEVVVNPIPGHREDVRGDRPLVILVNQGSTSASEILAGAFQQRDLAYVIGEKTPGIANGRNTWRVAGGRLNITVVETFVGPQQISLDGGVGVTPDLTVALDAAELAAGHDAQLEAALTYIREYKKP